MKRTLLVILLTCSLTFSFAQPAKFNSLAFFTTQSAMPFGKFSSLFTRAFHPGVEISRTKLFGSKKTHEWKRIYNAGYFFHRFVQHAIYLNAGIGYRYKIKRWGLETSLGGGLLQSIPATAKLKLNSDGEYKNDKGIGRLQVSANFGMGFSYLLPKAMLPDLRLFARYEQKLQLPFIKAYVPLLPYNSFLVGGEWSIKNRAKHK